MPTSKNRKLLLVGESNPYGSDPHYALYPAPDGCSGHRLCCLILGMQRATYLDSFERTNLCGGRWSTKEARARAQVILDEYADGGRVVLLGSKVCSAFGVPFDPFEVFDLYGVDLLVLPHPSGLCRLWNEPGAYDRARAAVAELAPELASLLGVVRGGDGE